MFIDEGAPASERVFAAAQHLARQHGDAIISLVMREDVQATAKSAGVSSPIYVQQCSGGVDAVLRAVQQWRPQLLLLDRSAQFVSESTVNSLVMQLPCPLAFVQ